MLRITLDTNEHLDKNEQVECPTCGSKEEVLLDSKTGKFKWCLVCEREKSDIQGHILIVHHDSKLAKIPIFKWQEMNSYEIDKYVESLKVLYDTAHSIRYSNIFIPKSILS